MSKLLSIPVEVEESNKYLTMLSLKLYEKGSLTLSQAAYMLGLNDNEYIELLTKNGKQPLNKDKPGFDKEVDN